MHVRALPTLTWQPALLRPVAASAGRSVGESFTPGEAPASTPSFAQGPPAFGPVQAEGWKLSEMAVVEDVARQARAVVEGTAPFGSYILNGDSGSGLTTLMKAMAGELQARGRSTLFAVGADLGDARVAAPAGAGGLRPGHQDDDPRRRRRG